MKLLISRSLLTLWGIFCLFPCVRADGTDSTPSLSSLPQCTINCLISALPSSSCAATNTTCICDDAALQDTLTNCVVSNCTVKEALFSKNFTDTTCNVPVRDVSRLMATNGYVFCGITTVVVVSRILYKVFGTAVGMGADDWSILVAHLFAIALTVVGTYGLADHGMGRDIWTISFDEITQVLQFLYMVELFYFLSISLLKMSILFFYMRIFTTPGTTKILWGTQAFNVLFTLSCCFAIIFQCTPVDYAWTRWDGEHQGTCLEFNPIVWTVAVVGIALDLWMLAIPLHTLRGLNLGTRKKIGVALMFIVGTLVTIVSIFRLATLTKFANSQNITWDSWEASFVSGIEIGLGTICASMPTARAAFSRCLSVMRTRTDSQYHFSQNNMKQGSGKRSRQAGEEIDMTHRSRTWSQLESTESGDIDEESLVQRKDGELSVKNYSGVVERQVPF